MTFRIWKSSGLINHLFFSSLFLLTPLFFEHRENLSVPLFAPRTPLSHASSSRAHSLVASRLRRHAPALHASAPASASVPSAFLRFAPPSTRFRSSQGVLISSMLRLRAFSSPRPPSLCYFLSGKRRVVAHAVINSGIGCLWASVAASLTASRSLAAPLPSSGKH